MEGEKYNELLEKFGKVKSPIKRAQISYLLKTRVAAAIENQEPGVEEIKTPMSEWWLGAGERFDKVLKEDPKEAFDMAVQITLLPVSTDKKVEDINKWIRGDGPSMLGREELKENLLDYLDNSTKSRKLVNTLSKNISFDFSMVNNSNEAFEDPECYLSLASILLGVKLMGDVELGENAKKLFEQTREKMENPNTVRVISYYENLEDTKWLADELNTFKNKQTSRATI